MREVAQRLETAEGAKTTESKMSDTSASTKATQRAKTTEVAKGGKGINQFLNQASKEVASRRGCGAKLGMHAARFALNFSEADFQRLLKLRMPDGLPVPIDYVVKVLYVKDRKPIAWLIQSA